MAAPLARGTAMTLLAYLTDAVEDATCDLPGVERRKMFGCDAWFAGGSIFALVWKHGRIGLKLPEPGARAELAGLPGAAPWTAGTKTMSGWVLVPEGFHDDADALRAWTLRAHEAALAAPARKAAPKKVGAQKAAPRQAGPGQAAPKGTARKAAAPKRPAARTR